MGKQTCKQAKTAGGAGCKFKMAEKQWQVVNKREIEEKWPLHSLVFEDKSAQLRDVLKENKVEFLSVYFIF